MLNVHRLDTMRLLVLLTLVGVAVAVPRGDGKIVGGYECSPHTRPYMVSLNYGYHFCGGVLINEQWVLSVAQCWQSPYAMQLILGEHNLRVFEGTEQLLKTENIIWHPSYDYQTLDYDIMLIKLFHPVKVTDAVKPLPLPTGCPYGGIPCVVAGWGVTHTDNMQSANLLQCVNVPIVDDEECEKSYPGLLTRRMVCAGVPEGGKDACNGDAGSPLVCWGELHGLVSWGQGCGLPNYPGVYVKVCEFVHWIKEVMEANP